MESMAFKAGEKEVNARTGNGGCYQIYKNIK
jgi:hypothetical protein